MDIRDLDLLLKKSGFPERARLSLCADAERLLQNENCAALIRRRTADYAAGRKFTLYSAADELEAAAKDAGVDGYAAQMLFYLFLAPQLQRFYRERGLPEALFEGAMADLLCKARECFAVFGVWGSFVACWFSLFFDFTLYTLGRLEFRLTSCPFDYEKNGLRIERGQPCIDVHIPSREPLTRASLDDAYAQAAAFFAHDLNGVPTTFRCESWLLADYHDAMLPEDSGILLFAHDYDCVRQTPDTEDLWRIFGGEDTDKPETLSENTALQRAYKARLCARLPIYGGEGLFFYSNHLKGQTKS